MTTDTPDSPSAHDQATRHDPIYDELHESADFIELRRRFRGFVVPATVAFLSWYLLYVVMSNWADDFMSNQVVGHINVALVFGLLQFASTFLHRVALLAVHRTATWTRWPATSSCATTSGQRVMCDELGDPRHHPVHRRRRASRSAITFWASRQNKGAADYYAGGRYVQRLPERPRHLWRLHVGRVVPRHLRG